MQRKLIIDGYNLIYQFPELRKWMERDLEGARQSLVSRLADHAIRTKSAITLVFDGDDRVQDSFDSVPGVKVLFSRLPDTADHLIKRIIDEIRDGSEWAVVSSDNEIVEYARLHGIATAPSRSFAYGASEEPTRASEKKYKHSMSDEELEEWMEIFQSKNDDDRNP